MKKLFTVSTIDFSLLIVESWHRAYLIDLKKQLGMNISRIMFFKSKPGVLIMRPEEDQDRLQNFIKGKAKTNPRYLISGITHFLRYYRKLRKLEQHPRLKWQYVKTLLDLSAKTLPFYIVVHWLGNNPKLMEYATSESNRGRIETQGYYDPLDRVLRGIYYKLLGRQRHFRRYFDVINTEEFKALMKTNKLPKIEELRKRKNNYFMYRNTFLSGRIDLQKIVRNYGYVLEKYEVKGLTKIQGDIAYRGKVKGTVYVVEGKQDLSEVKKKDVLVTQMTSPDYVFAVKRVAAVVTDFGGIMSHAAIISRELKKPCIIGTKIATKVFKDGDLVEVDAKKGVVRKIK